MMTKEKQKKNDPAPQNKVTHQDKLEEEQKKKSGNKGQDATPDPTGRT